MIAPIHTEATRLLAALFLVLLMLGMGLALGGEPAADKAEKRHKRRLLVRALAFNLVLLPLVAVTLTRGLGVTDDVAIALLLLASTPGGRFAPQLGKLAGAELGLSVEITLFLAKLVSFTAPVTARLVLHTHHIELRELPFILQLLLLQMLPYVVGRQIRKRRRAFAERLARPLELVMWASLAALVVVMVARVHGLAVLAGARGWWPVILFALIAPALGWLVGGPTAPTRRAVAVSANARDFAIASLIASIAFSGTDVQLATFGVWLLLLLADFVFVMLARRRGRAPEARRLQPAHAEGGAT